MKRLIAPSKRLLKRALLVTAFLLVGISRAADDDPAESESATGSWRWVFIMPDGSRVEPRVKLKQEGDTLTGSTKFRDGLETHISDGKVNGNDLSFTVKRERNGRTVITTYKGTRNGDRITGVIESDWNNEKQVYPWQARRASKDPGGKWSWKLANRRGETNDFILELQHEGEKLTGNFTAFGVDTEIEDGAFKDGEVSFTVAREAGDDLIISSYRGKIAADVIRGRVSIRGGERDRLIEWIAKRVD
jgi:hypothetical protein